MPYEITITKTETREVESGGEWTAIEKRPLTEEEAKDTFTTGKLQLKTVYGFTPKITKSETVTIEIYRQVVKELELPEIIRAINMID